MGGAEALQVYVLRADDGVELELGRAGLLQHAAVDIPDLAGDKGGIVGGEVDAGAGDVGGAGDAAEGDHFTGAAVARVGVGAREARGRRRRWAGGR